MKEKVAIVGMAVLAIIVLGLLAYEMSKGQNGKVARLLGKMILSADENIREVKRFGGEVKRALAQKPRLVLTEGTVGALCYNPTRNSRRIVWFEPEVMPDEEIHYLIMIGRKMIGANFEVELLCKGNGESYRITITPYESEVASFCWESWREAIVEELVKREACDRISYRLP